MKLSQPRGINEKRVKKRAQTVGTRGFVGDDTYTVKCGDDVINYEIDKDPGFPESNNQDSMESLRPFFFFSWLRCLALLLAALQRDRRLAPARSSCEMVPGNFRRFVSGEFRRKTTRKCMAYANIFLNITCMLGECQCDIT